MSTSIYSCSICEAPVGPRNTSGKCRSCAKKVMWENLDEAERSKRVQQLVSTPSDRGGRPKGSKNSVPYVRTTPSVTNPWWLNTKKVIQKRVRTWAQKSDSELATMINRQIETRIKNGTNMKKTYSGKYKIKNPEKYRGDPTNVQYRSMWERHLMKYFDENSGIVSWSSEEIIVPYLYEVDRKYHRYFVDFFIETKEGKKILIEVKPEKETSPPTGSKRTKRYINEGLTYVRNMNKWEAANEYAKDRGWEFQIWTEKTEPLKSMIGKPLKKLKPLPKFTRKKTK
jgi:hypothetical protein